MVSLHHDIRHMRHAVGMARRVWGRTAPNPAVGCVLVQEGQVVVGTHTAPGGRPHAETAALELAGERARGATAFVTLEPCAHHGETPPCAEALIAAGVARVVVACRDADTRVCGNGLRTLREAGIAVTEGVGEADALPLYAGFFSRIRRGLPEINLKIATSLDGKICYADGSSRWITGEPARMYGHRLRAEHEAILTGIGTALADDPLLNCRLPGLEAASPLRAVMDSALRLPIRSKLVRSAREIPLIVFTLKASARKRGMLEARGAEVVELPEMTLEYAARTLAARGISRVLVEAGQRMSGHALQSGLLSRLYWFRAPMVIGEVGRAAFTVGVELQAESCQMLGEDRLEVYAARR